MTQPRPALREIYTIHEAPEVRAIVLANGLTAIAHRHDAAPLVAASVYLRGGSAFEGPWSGSGISHLLEHVVSGDGAGEFDEAGMIARADAIGGLANAYTCSDHICHHIVTPSEHLAAAVNLLADYIVRSHLSRAVFEREKGVVLREMEREQDDPLTVLDDLLIERIYAGHPMQHSVIGRADIFERLTYDDLQAYHDLLHRPARVVVVLTGDLEIRAAIDAVCSAFAGLEGRPTTLVLNPPPPDVLCPRRARRTMDVDSASVIYAWPTVPEGHADDALIDVISSILTDGSASRLVRSLRWDSGLAFDVGGTHDSTWHTPGVLQVSVQCAPKQMEDIERAVVAEMTRLHEEPVAEGELERARRQLHTAVDAGRQTAEGLASQLGEDYLASGDITYTDLYKRKIDAATPESLQRAARDILRPDRRVVVAVTPRQRPSRRAPPASRRPAAIEQRTIESGLRVICRRMTASRFTAAYAAFHGGLRAESDEDNGVGQFLSETILRGTQRHDAERLADLLGRKGGRLSAASGFDTFGMELIAPSEEWDDLFQIFAETLAMPALRPEEIEKARPSILDAQARVDEDWRSELTRFARSRFFVNSPYRRHGLGTPQTLRAISADDLRRLHDRICTGTNGVLAVAGDVEPERLFAAAEGAFAALRRSPPQTWPPPAEAPAPRRDRLFVKQSAPDRALASLLMAFPGHRTEERAIRAPLTIVETVLCGFSMSGGRLFSALRGGDRDLAYEVSGLGFAGAWPGWSAFSAACQPSNVGPVYARMRSQIDQIREGRLGQEEWDRAKSMIIAGERNSLQTPAEYAVRLASDALMGLGFEDWRAFEEEVRAAEKDASVDIARDRLRFATIVVTTPAPGQLKLPMDPDEVVARAKAR